MNRIDAYVDEVLKHIPGCLPQRRRIEADLRSHLADRVDGGDTVEEAVARMGPAEEVAREFLSELELRPAPLGRRFAAFLIDIGLGMLVAAPLVPLVVLLVLGEPMRLPPGAVALLFFFGAALGGAVLLLSLVYYPVAEAIFGQTVGKRLLGLCVTLEDGGRIGWLDAIIRRIPWYVELFWLDAVFALFTERRQRAFDLVAGTIVVRCDDDARAPAGG
ncbi:MAG: RDD family protein [Gemmatimonadota bacterium]